MAKNRVKMSRAAINTNIVIFAEVRVVTDSK